MLSKLFFPQPHLSFFWLRQSGATLCWVPGQGNVVGNHEADKLAKGGARGEGAVADVPPLVTINILKEAIGTTIKAKQQEAWQHREKCATARKTVASDR